MTRNEIDELLATIEVAAQTAQSELSAYGTNYEAFEPVPWFEPEPWDDGFEEAYREMYVAEMER